VAEVGDKDALETRADRIAATGGINTMRRLFVGLGAAGLLILGLVAAVSAASPSPTPAAPTVIAPVDQLESILGLSLDEIHTLREQGQSLAQIAKGQKVDPEKLVDALATTYSQHIDLMQQHGRLTSDQATELKAQATTRAQSMVEQTGFGPMGAGFGFGHGFGPMGGGFGHGPGFGPWASPSTSSSS